MKSKWLVTGMLTLASVSLFAQIIPTTRYDSGYSTRNKQLSHYNKMVSWDDSQYKEFTYRKLSATGNITEFMNWRAIFPAGYDKNNPQKYPMIVMLHGAGESGRSWTGVYDYATTDPRYDNNGHNLLHGGSEHRTAVNRAPSDSRAFPGIVIFPQVSHNGSWESGWSSGVLKTNGTMAATIIEYMIATYNADANRVYLHGLSNGAKGTWDLSSKRPDLFAAILPMSGVGTNRTEMSKIHNTTAVWLFQGGTDTNPTQSGGQTMINSIIAEGGNPRFTVYPNTGHGTWGQAYNEPDFFSWMLAQDKRKIYVFGGNASICSGETLKMGISAGYLAYQWTRDGIDIPGATTRYLTVNESGTYRVRFQRRNSQWEESFPQNVNSVSPSTYSPELTFTGSIILPIDVSNKNVVDLTAPAGYSEYYWYKDNVLVATTTTRTRNILSGSGSATTAGAYTVAVKETSGCKSQKSNVITAVYKSPHTGPTAPVLGTFTALSSTEVRLNWADAPAEGEYEIWRSRSAANGYVSESLKLVGRAVQNSTSFVDTDLRPMGKYSYRVRSVGGNDGLFSSSKSITLPEDSAAPTAPTNLVVSNVSGTSATLSWTASVDNDLVSGYEIFSNSVLVATVTGTSFNLSNLTPGSSYAIEVKAVDGRGNRSAAAVTTIATPAHGLFYTYYETGSLSDLATFNFGQTPAETGTVANFDISVRNRDDQFLFSFDGFIEISEVGTYTFFTASDDGSLLYIDGALVVNNDGLHGVVEQSGSYTFSATGRYPIKVTFFENGGGEYLQVQYDPPGAAPKQLIPSAKLYLTDDTMAMMRTTQETSLSVYPNPFTSKLTLDLKGNTSGTVKLVSGMNFSRSFTIPKGASEVDIDVSDIPPGVYYLISGSKTIRILKEK
jgi:predicted esterase